MPDTAEEAHGGDPYACSLYKMLPKPMQESTQESVHLLEYLHTIPLGEVGMPEYYAKLTGKLRDKKKKNLIYAIDGGLFVHIMEDPEGGRAFYISVEPRLGAEWEEDDLIRRIDLRLLDYVMEFEGAETPEAQQEVLEMLLDGICGGGSAEEATGLKAGVGLKFRKFAGKAGGGSLALSDRDRQVIKYIMVRDKIGLGALEPFIRDTKVFNSLRSAYEFTTNEELDEFVLRLSERIKKPVTFRNPIVDATLPDGSRINIVYGEDVSRRGSNLSFLLRPSETCTRP